MAQFYYAYDIALGKEFFFSEKESAHLKVFRVKKGEKIKVFSPLGRYEVSIKDFKGGLVSALPLRKIEDPPKQVKINLFFSFVEKSAFEEILRKGTETGCDSFIPIICEFTQKNHILDIKEKRERFEEIIFSSVKQCERPDIPSLLEPVEFKEIFSFAVNPFIFSKENSKNICLLSDKISKEISAVIGPEGGFSPSELSYAENKAVFASLGPNILRTQTAAAAACALISALKSK
ncbi:MAG: 16S rRNA (uracil(1498)-N(3))-methyltransferase [Elusimicrobia bacterium]|nr:16S rRNA (uracil(1498)-N(3))-methyltransferase [Elusimicrobiota bacterium]